MLDDAHAEAERVIHRPHPLGVTLGQVVVHGHDVDTASGDRVEIRGQRRHQRLALAGGHLADLALVQNHAADQLDVEVTHTHRTAGRVPADREGLDQDRIDLGAVGQALAELVAFRAKGIVGERLELRFERVDGNHVRLKSLDVALVLGTEDFSENGIQHASTIIQAGLFGPATCRRGAPGRGGAPCR